MRRRKQRGVEDLKLRRQGKIRCKPVDQGPGRRKVRRGQNVRTTTPARSAWRTGFRLRWNGRREEEEKSRVMMEIWIEGLSDVISAVFCHRRLRVRSRSRGRLTWFGPGTLSVRHARMKVWRVVG